MVPHLQSLAALAGRLALSAIFIVDGWAKIPNYDGVAHYMEEYGVPSSLLPVVIATELG